MGSLFNPFSWYPAMTTYTQGAGAMPQEWIDNAVVDNTPAAPVVWGTNPPNAGLKIPTGLNPGFMQAVPTYNTTSPVQNQYYWGAHPYQAGTTFDANLAKQGAPAQSWGTTSPSWVTQNSPWGSQSVSSWANDIVNGYNKVYATPAPQIPAAIPKPAIAAAPKASPFASVTTTVPKAAPAVKAPTPVAAPKPVVKAPAYVPPAPAPKATANLAQALKATQSAPVAKR